MREMNNVLFPDPGPATISNLSTSACAMAVAFSFRKCTRSTSDRRSRASEIPPMSAKPAPSGSSRYGIGTALSSDKVVIPEFGCVSSNHHADCPSTERVSQPTIRICLGSYGLGTPLSEGLHAVQQSHHHVQGDRYEPTNSFLSQIGWEEG
jgi:hypothetical protein